MRQCHQMHQQSKRRCPSSLHFKRLKITLTTSITTSILHIFSPASIRLFPLSTSVFIHSTVRLIDRHATSRYNLFVFFMSLIACTLPIIDSRQ